MRNLTQGSPVKLILTFSIPLLLGNLFQQLYTVVDSAVVGRLISVDALAAVGATGRMAFLIIGFSWGATAGLTIPVARYFGANDITGVRRAIVASGVVAALVALAITAVGLIFGDALLRLVKTPENLLEMAQQYQHVMFGTAALTVAFNWLAAVIRAIGDSRTPLIFLIMANIINAGLSIFFVGTLGFGVAATAATTAVAQAISVIACLWYVRRKMPQIFPDRQAAREGLRLLGEPARIGLPMGFQMSVIGIGTVVLGAAINSLGSDAVAASTIGGRLEGIAMSPLNTFGIAMTTFVAQNYGAGQYKRIRTAVLRMSILATIIAFAVGAIQVIFTDQLIAIFTSSGSAPMVEMVRTQLRVSAAMYFTLGILFIVRNAIQGLGATAVPTVAGFMELALRSGAGIFLGATFGWLGVAWGNPLAWAGAFVVCAASWLVHRKKLLALEQALDQAGAERSSVGTATIIDQFSPAGGDSEIVIAA